ncbi:hypothetical protein TNCV_2919071 [Trichonephila clavipes]|nr:hypothetical protein TNCV_2919071 [Trichonephila clavipes]
MPARTWPCQAAYSNASGFSGSVTDTTVVEICSGKASIGSVTNEKCSKHLSLLYFSDRSRVKNGMYGVVENGTHVLHGNPTMTLCLIAKGTFSHVLWVQEHDRDPFEKTRGAPTCLNVFKCVLGTWISHTNGTDIEVM